eukprot:SM000006S19359  [mRNA]  locus=s6:347582:350950:+ [translate_table: standard]
MGSRWTVIGHILNLSVVKYRFEFQAGSFNTADCVSLRRPADEWELVFAPSQHLDQSQTLTHFFLELRDMLEKLMHVDRAPQLAPAAFYSLLLDELAQVGWERVAWLSPDLHVADFYLCDGAGRQHALRLTFPAAYPEHPPTASTDLPEELTLQWIKGTSLQSTLAQFEEVLKSYQELWDCIDDLDANTLVLEPERPTRSDTFRRIALGGHCTILITIDAQCPRSLPDCQFTGSDAAVGQFRDSLEANLGEWQAPIPILGSCFIYISLSTDRMLRTNLERALRVSLPGPGSVAAAGDVTSDCSICYTYHLASDEQHAAVSKTATEGTSRAAPAPIPDQICNNEACGRPFHQACLPRWLQSLLTTRRQAFFKDMLVAPAIWLRVSFDTLFGRCPYCLGDISVRMHPNGGGMKHDNRHWQAA